MPTKWKTAVTFLIHKKEYKQDCNNYRGIAILNVIRVYKVFTNCILSRIKGKAEEILGDFQGGFRSGRSTEIQIFILRQLFQKVWEFDKNVHDTLFFLSILRKRMIVFTEQA